MRSGGRQDNAVVAPLRYSHRAARFLRSRGRYSTVTTNDMQPQGNASRFYGSL